jgi:hypothetical protein
LTSRAVGGALLVLSLLLQGLATSRLLCPPSSIPSLAPLRIACPPRLWPFTDYPMFSEPHRKGDSLAWIEARIEMPDRTPRILGLYRVRTADGESWESAFEREERRLVGVLEPEIASSPRSSRLALQRHRLVLSEGGLVLP